MWFRLTSGPDFGFSGVIRTGIFDLNEKLTQITSSRLFFPSGTLQPGRREGEMGHRSTKKNRISGAEVQETMASVLDELIAYEEFRQTILPQLKKMVAEKQIG
jgi:hypothetical protein